MQQLSGKRLTTVFGAVKAESACRRLRREPVVLRPVLPGPDVPSADRLIVAFNSRGPRRKRRGACKGSERFGYADRGYSCFTIHRKQPARPTPRSARGRVPKLFEPNQVPNRIFSETCARRLKFLSPLSPRSACLHSRIRASGENAPASSSRSCSTRGKLKPPKNDRARRASETTDNVALDS